MYKSLFPMRASGIIDKNEHTKANRKIRKT